MIRNAWPLGAAGAQEIRALKLEGEKKLRQRQIRKETNSRGLGEVGFYGVSPLLPRAGCTISCLLQGLVFKGHRGFTKRQG